MKLKKGAAQEELPLSTPTEGKCADIIVDVPVNKLFSYFIPNHLSKTAKVGVGVTAPFRKKSKWGIITKTYKCMATEKLGKIIDIPDPMPLFTQEQIKLMLYTAKSTFTPPSEVIRAAVPSAFRKPSLWLWQPTVPVDSLPIPDKEKKIFSHALKKGGSTEKELIKAGVNKNRFKELVRTGMIAATALCEKKIRNKKRIKLVKASPSPHTGDKLTEKRKKILEILGNSTMEKNLLASQAEVTSGLIDRMAKDGLLTIEEIEDRRSSAFPRTRIMPDKKPELTQEQAKALTAIKKEMKNNSCKKFLLFGVTGSGKTEVYMRAIEEVLKKGKNALTLVPEIALTPQLIQRYRARFGEQLAVFHSALTEAQRVDQWRRIRSGKCKIVVGVRSAVLTPLQNIGLIVVDEEHEPSYKQEDRFLYHARTLAEKRAEDEGAVLILGSATPSIETFYRAKKGELHLLPLTFRPTGQKLPIVHIIDMKAEPKYFGQRLIMSSALRSALAARLEQNEQAILFLNRRGYFSFLLCRECGEGIKCPNCSVSLTVHSGGKRVRCHHCGLDEKAPTSCLSCGSEKISPVGFGTQQLEEEVMRFFPEARVLRIDRDTVNTRDAFDSMIEKLEKKKIDILIGTQMVAKGLDIPSVTMVGVVSADQSLHFPDFRSAERTFQLITQVAGRSGRGSKRGEVFIQTYNPDHKSIVLAALQDYEKFYEYEIKARQKALFPPFSNITAIKFSSTSESRILKAMNELKNIIDNILAHHITILGPAPAPIEKLAARYRWRMLLKHKNKDTLTTACKTIEPHIAQLARRYGIRYKFDMDPYQFM